MIINRADSIAAYDRFIQRVIDDKCVWLLVDNQSDIPVACDSHHQVDAYVVPVWSDRAYAERAQPLFPTETAIEGVPLENFIERTVPFLSDRGELLGPNWNSDLAGLEIDPREVLERLKQT